jgi:hypothetical protein
VAQPGEELASIDFESMIGGPLTAVIRAQTQAANTSVDFIRSVGFTEDDDGVNRPTMVTFTYSKPVEQTDDDGNVTTEVLPFELTVPFLTMVPIPFIRIAETTIDFNAKITAVQYAKTMSEHDLGVALEAKAGWGPFSAKLKTNYSYKRKSESGQEVNRTYSLTIHVRAVQDELPAGTERLLGILENTIQEIPSET